MAFVPNPHNIKKGDRVISLVPFKIQEGMFTSGHEFIVDEYSKHYDQREGDWTVLILRCPETGYKVNASSVENVKRKDVK